MSGTMGRHAEGNVATAKRYLRAIEDGAVGDTLATFFTDDVILEEMPNRLAPNGVRRNLAAALEAAVRGQQVASQRYQVLNAVERGEQVALEVDWTATLKVPIGSIPAGGTMHARFAVFLEFRNGKIAHQRNYDCFDPF